MFPLIVFKYCTNYLFIIVQSQNMTQISHLQKKSHTKYKKNYLSILVSFCCVFYYV